MLSPSEKRVRKVFSQAGWFAGLWLAGVASVASVGLIVRAFLH